MRQALSVTSECVPLVKTGGLADVAGALPGAMADHGWDLRTILPGYPDVMDALGRKTAVMALSDLYGGTAKVYSSTSGGLPLYVLHAPHLYDRSGTIYNDAGGHDFPDNPERFAALCHAAAEIAGGAVKGFAPEVVHGHDWQAGLTPYYIRKRGISAGSIFTIHNIAFQGLAPVDRMERLGLDRADFTADGLEYWNHVSTLKAGLVYADKVTTVSPTYARELATSEFGMGMSGVLQARGGDFTGVLNGIDTDVWNPITDPEIETFKSPKSKSKAKKALQAEFGLGQAEGPLTCVISRLSHQKGLDLLLEALPALLDRGGQFVLLGSGDPHLENAFREASHHPGVSVHVGYNEAMSHRIMAGADAVLIPSRFEPCGLTQLMGLRYGTVPVVSLTGGLVDTVINATPMSVRSGVATGIQFSPLTAHALAQALITLCDLYAQPKVWSKIQRNGMTQDVGWSTSAAEYAALYDQVA